MIVLLLFGKILLLLLLLMLRRCKLPGSRLVSPSNTSSRI
jgi:hypothetical protein